MNFNLILSIFKSLENFGSDPTVRFNGYNVLHRLLEKVADFDVIEYVLNTSKLILPYLEINSFFTRFAADLFDCNERTEKGNTPLHIVAAFGVPEMDYTPLVENLLKHGADVNLTDIDHCRTPLMTAVKTENLSVIRALVSNFGLI